MQATCQHIGMQIGLRFKLKCSNIKCSQPRLKFRHLRKGREDGVRDASRVSDCRVGRAPGALRQRGLLLGDAMLEIEAVAR